LILSDIMMKAGERKGYYAGLFESILGTGFFLGPFLGGMVASLAIRYVFMMPAIFTGSFLALKALDVLRSHAH
jgi:MFS family permease